MSVQEKRRERKLRELAVVAQFKWASKLADRSWPAAEWQAYLKWRSEQGHAEDLYCPPPPGVERGKIWSRQLRRMWPNHGRVFVTGGTARAHQWCKEHGSHYWDVGGNVWYFRERDVAVLFKLTFGGK
jgi:hypothetical protein